MTAGELRRLAQEAQERGKREAQDATRIKEGARTQNSSGA
jgi:hypothetical protein